MYPSHVVLLLVEAVVNIEMGGGRGRMEEQVISLCLLYKFIFYFALVEFFHLLDAKRYLPCCCKEVCCYPIYCT